jgi:hypothetical protein
LSFSSLIKDVILGWVVKNSIGTILALNQLDLAEGFNAKINQRQVSDKISFEQPGPGVLEEECYTASLVISNIMM